MGVMRICSKCGQLKEVGVKQVVNGIKLWRAQCKDCKRLEDKKWSKDHADWHRDKNGRLRKRNRSYIYQYLFKHPCIDCGESDPITLEFDHVRGDKVASVKDMMKKSVSIATLQAEIDKCEVRCANCHKRKTWGELAVKLRADKAVYLAQKTA